LKLNNYITIQSKEESLIDLLKAGISEIKNIQHKHFIFIITNSLDMSDIFIAHFERF
jgi:hypothetical protein